MPTLSSHSLLDRRRKDGAAAARSKELVLNRRCWLQSDSRSSYLVAYKDRAAAADRRAAVAEHMDRAVEALKTTSHYCLDYLTS